MWFVRPVYSDDLSGIVSLLRVRTGPRAMRDSCRPWSRTSPTKSRLSSPKKASVPPSWMLRASQRKSCILGEFNLLVCKVFGTFIAKKLVSMAELETREQHKQSQLVSVPHFKWSLTSEWKPQLYN